MTVDLVVFCERIERGCTFVARTYVGERFYTGTGATALEAIAWCLDDLVRRRYRGEPHRMALPSGARPGDFSEAA